MLKNLLSKVLVIGIIVLFVGVSIQPAFANKIPISTISDSEEDFIETTDGNNYRGDFGLGFILCTVSATDWSSYEHYPLVRNVKFELTDYDTGEIIQEKFRSYWNIFIYIFTKRTQLCN